MASIRENKPHMLKKKSGKMKSKGESSVNKYKKFKGNVTEGQGFADVRKQKMMYQYKKLQRKEQRQQECLQKKVQQIYREDEEGGDKHRVSRSRDKHQGKRNSKMSAFERPQTEHRKKQEEKKKKREEFTKKQKEKDEALEAYQKKKKKRQKYLAKRTEKGQPHMGSQMKYLLAKIQAQSQS